MIKKNKKKALFVSAAFAMAALTGFTAFSGCGSSSADSGNAYSETAVQGSADEELYSTGEESSDASAYYDFGADNSAAAVSEDTETSGITDRAATENTAAVSQSSSAGNEGEKSETDRKLIVTWNLTMQTEQYDEAVTAIRESVEASDGYIESENETSYSDENRFLNLTVRMPEDCADEWVNGTAAYGTIVSRSRNTEDATLQYVDTESTLKALRTEQESLLAMMEKASEMSDLIAIQSELTEVNAEIESYESSLRYLDNQVDYTTVYLDVEEVSRETAVKQTFGQEIRETFLNSIDGLKCTFRNLAVGIIGNSVIILLMAVIAAAVVLIVRKAGKILRRRNAKRHSADQAPKGDIPDQVKDPEESERS